MLKKPKSIFPCSLTNAFQGQVPDRLEPQLLTPANFPPEDVNWLHEIKHDGYRMTVIIRDGKARLWTRNGYDWSYRLPSLLNPIEDLCLTTAAFDAELVCLDDKGRTEFAQLQSCVARRGEGRPLLYLFDMVHLDGWNLIRVPLLERKLLLRQILEEHTDSGTSVLRYSDHLVGDGARVYEHSCRLGLEGIVSKRLDSPYRPGRRSQSWLKVKNPAYYRQTAGPWMRR